MWIIAAAMDKKVGVKDLDDEVEWSYGLCSATRYMSTKESGKEMSTSAEPTLKAARIFDKVSDYTFVTLYPDHALQLTTEKLQLSFN